MITFLPSDAMVVTEKHYPRQVTDKIHSSKSISIKKYSNIQNLQGADIAVGTKTTIIAKSELIA